MAHKSEQPPVWVIRNGRNLEPEMNEDAERISQFPQGQRIKVTLSTGRVPKRLRFYWSFLQRVVKATECAPNAESLHETVKLMNGYTTPVMVKAMTIMIPRSISFGSMSEDEFTRFLDDAVKFIASTYGISPEEAFGGE